MRQVLQVQVIKGQWGCFSLNISSRTGIGKQLRQGDMHQISESWKGMRASFHEIYDYAQHCVQPRVHNSSVWTQHDM